MRQRAQRAAKVVVGWNTGTPVVVSLTRRGPVTRRVAVAHRRSSVTTGSAFATAGAAARSARPGERRRAFRTLFAVLSAPTDGRDWVVLTEAALPVDELHAWAATPRAGAVVTFIGVVRDHAEGREGVYAMTYEAYEEPAGRVMHEIVAEARRRRPDVERVALLHRIGRLELSEPSVAVAVSAPHRDHAFEAARYCIDTLKETAPIWKQEHWDAGSAWAHGERAIRPVGERVGSSTTGREA
jgi:molybdopterin synthase catalytic subunit